MTFRRLRVALQRAQRASLIPREVATPCRRRSKYRARPCIVSILSPTYRRIRSNATMGITEDGHYIIT